MNINIVKNYEEMSQLASKMINDFVQTNPFGVIGLATGQTPEGVYKLLVDAHHNLDIDWSNITTFNLDEYIGINATSPFSYAHYMHEKLFKYLNIKSENTHIPLGQGDYQKNIDNYEQKIKNAGGINLQLLGIGSNGHIGFNEPGTSFDSKTHVVDLATSTISDNKQYFKTIDDVPKKAITIGLNTIMQAQQIILIASGLNKAEAIAKLVEGKITPKIPASILQNHDHVTLIIDQKAASKLHQHLI